MRSDRVIVFWSAGGLAGGLLAATVWAQSPVPPTGPVAGRVYCETEGPVRHAVGHAVRHTGRVLQDNLIGYPEYFVEPPPGFYNYEIFGVMKGKASYHKFTLYRTDFLAGSNQLSPVGATRFNLMASRLRGWLGPVVVEWSPDQPGLAESRREAVLGLLRGTGMPVVAERVVIGPSPYPGMPGTDAANNHNVLITRDQQAPATYSVTPTAGAGFGGAGGTP